MGHAIKLHGFLSGAVMMATWVLGIFFFRFWRQCQDRFFFFFGVSFWLMSLERLLTAAMQTQLDGQTYLFFLIRLTSFVLIIYAIWEKNRKNRPTLFPPDKSQSK